jgi:acyl carrier protein
MVSGHAHDAVPKGSRVTTILAALTDIIRAILPDDAGPITPQTCFGDIPGWEQADLVSAVVEAECRFDIQFELTDIDRLITVGDLVGMVLAKQALTSV